MENSSRHSRWSSGFLVIAHFGPPHFLHHIHFQLVPALGHIHEHLGAHLLIAEAEGLTGRSRRSLAASSGVTYMQRLGGADRGAHGAQADRSAVVAHVALDHQFHLDLHLGHPKGQARTQLEQAMQRGLRALRTTPSSPFLMASAGQDWAQAGSSQCMHTMGVEAVVHSRSMKSKVDRRNAAMRAALPAGVHAALAADAARGST
jgi:hypothetical protein